jgi:hypothetical protein
MGTEFELLLDAREQIVQSVNSLKDKQGNVVMQETQVSGPLHRIIDGIKKKVGTYVALKRVQVDMEGNATCTITGSSNFRNGSQFPINKTLFLT